MLRFLGLALAVAAVPAPNYFNLKSRHILADVLDKRGHDLLADMRTFHIVNFRSLAAHGEISGHPETLQLQFATDNTTFALQLFKTEIFGRNYKEVVMDHNGDFITVKKRADVENCHYQGFVGNEGGRAFVSTCGGVKGVVHAYGQHLHIIPVGSLFSKFQHKTLSMAVSLERGLAGSHIVVHNSELLSAKQGSCGVGPRHDPSHLLVVRDASKTNYTHERVHAHAHHAQKHDEHEHEHEHHVRKPLKFAPLSAKTSARPHDQRTLSCSGNFKTLEVVVVNDPWQYAAWGAYTEIMSSTIVNIADGYYQSTQWIPFCIRLELVGQITQTSKPMDGVTYRTCDTLDTSQQVCTSCTGCYNSDTLSCPCSSSDLKSQSSSEVDTTQLLSTFTTAVQVTRYNQIRNIFNSDVDNIALLTQRDFAGSTVGLAWVGTQCLHTSTGSSAVVQSSSIVVGYVASIYAHEVGHNWGMDHDTPGSTHYIMAPSMSENEFGTEFSSQSVQNMNSWYQNRYLSSGYAQCLENQPSSGYTGGVCGNGLIDDGEQCDPGVEVDTCCVNCQLVSGCVCANSMPCCANGQYRPSSFVCRPATDTQCDRAESCSGTSAICPTDNYFPVETPCTDAKGFSSNCYHGHCPLTRSSFCSTVNGNEHPNDRGCQGSTRCDVVECDHEGESCSIYWTAFATDGNPRGTSNGENAFCVRGICTPASDIDQGVATPVPTTEPLTEPTAEPSFEPSAEPTFESPDSPSAVPSAPQPIPTVGVPTAPPLSPFTGPPRAPTLFPPLPPIVPPFSLPPFPPIPPIPPISFPPFPSLPPTPELPPSPIAPFTIPPIPPFTIPPIPPFTIPPIPPFTIPPIPPFTIPPTPDFPFAPTPESPTPPTPEFPTPESPTPEFPTPESPTPESPTPESPTPDSPTVQSPTPESPTPESPTVQSPTTPVSLAPVAPTTEPPPVSQSPTPSLAPVPGLPPLVLPPSPGSAPTLLLAPSSSPSAIPTSAPSPAPTVSPETFTFNNTIRSMVIPATGNYSILVAGAQGGSTSESTGGLGAEMRGEFFLVAGQTLWILAGEHPSVTAEFPGGGGGSFVATGSSFSTATPLIVAGGGGGAFAGTGTGAPVNSASNGLGGAQTACGGGGGGFFTSGSQDAGGFGGGQGFRQGGNGGEAPPGISGYQRGGFGGGGVADNEVDNNCRVRAGSGGGYSGGRGAAAGRLVDAGEPGGSFNSGVNQVNRAGVNAGHGSVTIASVRANEPGGVLGSQKDSSMSVGAVVGAAVGGTAALIVLLLLAVCCCRGALCFARTDRRAQKGALPPVPSSSAPVVGLSSLNAPPNTWTETTPIVVPPVADSRTLSQRNLYGPDMRSPIAPLATLPEDDPQEIARRAREGAESSTEAVPAQPFTPEGGSPADEMEPNEFALHGSSPAYK